MADADPADLESTDRMTHSLDALALHHKTDKSSAGHKYTPIYEPYVAALRLEPVTLLEIGVRRGASVRMWRDYFPNGRIFGVDIIPDAKVHAGDRLEILIGDQRDREFLARVKAATGRLDIIVDDGSHRYADQKATLTELWPHLKPGGIYILEDTHTSYHPRHEMGYRKRETTIEMLKDVVDDIYVSLHRQPPMLGRVASIAFHKGTTIMVKLDAPRRPDQES
jgi:SAM-dependent methyltransferase